VPTDLPITVLVVEDSPGDAILVRRKLATFHVTQVTSLSEALQALDKATFGIILLDLNLPDSMGVETIARMRAKVPAVPIIVITGLLEVDLAVKALSAGAQDFYTKENLDEHLLSRSIHRIIQASKAP
jgi:DNA-binding response OmpR family regulator